MAMSADRRRALRLLAGSPHGCTEAIMLAHGFPPKMLADLIGDGLATTEPGTARVGGQQINVRWMMITDAGRRALAG
jgi:hypothetical protein